MTTLSLAVRGDLKEWTTSIQKSVSSGSSKALRISTFGLRKDIRARIRRAGFVGKVLPRAVAGKVTGENGRVYSVAIYPAGRGRTQPLDLIQLFDQGTTITARNGQWLAVPTGNGPRRSGRGGVRMASPRETDAMGWKLVAIPAKNGNMVLVSARGSYKIVTHVLIKMSRLGKRYDLNSAVEIWKQKMPKILAGEINKMSMS
jgi:hypothetical protein